MFRKIGHRYIAFEYTKLDRDDLVRRYMQTQA